MADAEELEPVPGHEAFHRRDSGALQSQAAFLLLLGRQLGHRGTVTRDDVADEDAEALNVPALVTLGRPEDIAQMRVYSQAGVLGFDASGYRVTDRSNLSKLVEALYEVRTRVAATNLVEACLYVPDALVRHYPPCGSKLDLVAGLA